jgi:WD40 repeat protein
MSSMPRGERPLDEGDSPLLRFARDLRQIRAAAGSPTYRELAQRAHFSVTTLSEAAGGRKLPGLDVTLAYVRACGGDESTWSQRWHEVSESLIQTRASPSPYVGLSAFAREDADRFFGREKLTNALRNRLETQHFLAVFGASGEGKSSLLKAGLAQHFDNPVSCTPGTDPDSSIADALAKKPDLLIVDQFEEVFTLCEGPGRRQAFLDLLLNAPCKTVIAVRSDFYPHCSQHPDLAEALTDAQVLIGTMTPDELRRAITQPAAKVSCTVEGALLTTLIAEAAGRSGVLPLVSHALLETWHRKRGNILTVSAYEAAGGIDGALAQSAEAAYAELTEEQQHLARQLLLRLAADGTKRPVPRSEVIGDEVLDALAAARLVTVGENTVEVTHEALFRAWPRLANWLDEDREGLRTHRRLTEAARLWEELDRDSGALYRTVRLTEATEWAGRTEPALTKAEDAFLAASRNLSRRRTRRLRWAAAGLIALVLATTISAVTATQQRAEVERLGRVALSQQLAALSAALMTSNPDESALKALAAYQTSPTQEARSQVFSTAFSRQREISALGLTVATGNGVIGVAGDHGVQVYDSTTLAPVANLPTNGSAFGLDFAPDGRIATADPTGRVTLRSGPRGQPEVLRKSGDQSSLVFTDDGRELVVGGQIWDLDTRRIRAELPIGPVPRRLDVLGDTLAVYGHDSVTLWSISTARQIGGFTINGRISDLKLLPGDTAVVGTMDGPLQVWSTATGTPVRDLASPRSPVNLATNADRTVLAATGLGADDIGLWDVVRWTPMPSLRMDRLKQSVAFTSDSRLVVLTDTSLRMWSRSSVPMASGHAVQALAVDHDGTVLTFDDGGFIERRDAGLGRISRVATGATGRSATAFSGDGTLLATSGNGETLAVRDLTGKVVSSPNPAEAPTRMVFAVETLATLGAARSTAVWNVTSKPTPVQVSSFFDGAPSAVAFGRSDHEIVIGTEEGLVAVRDTGTWDTKGLGKVHDGAVRAFAVSPDQRVLATAGDDGLITLWDTATWRQISELRGHTSGVTALAFSPDSARLGSGGKDRNVVVWDLGEHEVWATLTGHAQGVTHVAWMPDGRSVVSAGSDALLVWPLDVETALRALS